jgi:hypothetical protein
LIRIALVICGVTDRASGGSDSSIAIWRDHWDLYHPLDASRIDHRVYTANTETYGLPRLARIHQRARGKSARRDRDGRIQRQDSDITFL